RKLIHGVPQYIGIHLGHHRTYQRKAEGGHKHPFIGFDKGQYLFEELQKIHGPKLNLSPGLPFGKLIPWKGRRNISRGDRPKETEYAKTHVKSLQGRTAIPN